MQVFLSLSPLILKRPRFYLPMHYYRVAVKRLFATVFLLIFLLNVLGYYGVLLGLRAHTGDEFSARLTSDMYDLGATITLRIPISIPYAIESSEYVPASGKFEHNGEFYHIVKQRFHPDALYVVCIKDQGSSDLTQALAKFVEGFTDAPEDGSSNVAPQGLIKDFVQHQTTIANLNSGWELVITPSSSLSTLVDSFFASVIHPPERA
jgi:hypothetical protein